MHKRFVVGIDRAKMRLYDCDEQPQVVDAGQPEGPVEVLENKLFTDWKV